MRVGFGYDIHRLVAERELILGGVHVPFPCGLEGHSDGDVLLHAIIDALLGAAALGDIGSHFPSNDPRNKDISSSILLKSTVGLLSAQGWQAVNVDATIVAELPRLAPHLEKMRSQLSKLLAMPPDKISIKAKTNDGLGFLGRGEAIAAFVVATVEETQ